MRRDPCVAMGRSGLSQSSNVEGGRADRRSCVTRSQIAARSSWSTVSGTAADHRTGDLRPRSIARILREKEARPAPHRSVSERPRRTGPAGIGALYCLAGREAYVSTQEAQACSHAWIPRADAHAERPRGHQAAPAQGSQAAHAVTAGPGSPGGRRKRGRLSRSGDFDRVYREGHSHANRFLVLYAFPRREAGAEETRLGISVGRKVGGAVERNAVKRALREAFWSLDDAPSGHDLVLVARPDLAGLLERDGAQ